MPSIARSSISGPSGGCNRVSLWVLLLSNVLVFQLTYNYVQSDHSLSPTVLSLPAENSKSPLFSLDFPRGSTEALPSIRTTTEEAKTIDRQFYGGVGDKKHLGGFVEYDGMGVSPATWKYMITRIGVKSILDVGCGRGISTSWFLLHGVDAMCAEGSHDAVVQSLVPDVVVEHDFSRGPWWPPKTVDAVWCVEFLEHVGRQFHKNYIPAFRKAALIFVSHSMWGGWHHVEVHDNDWWIQKLEFYGFRYSEHLTDSVHNTAKDEKGTALGPDGKEYNAQHIWLNMQVFINPVVAALPAHAHLLADHGCYDPRLAKPGNIVNRECGTGKAGPNETPLPKEFYPLEITEEMDKKWEELVKKHIKTKE